MHNLNQTFLVKLKYSFFCPITIPGKYFPDGTPYGAGAQKQQSSSSSGYSGGLYSHHLVANINRFNVFGNNICHDVKFVKL